MEDHEFLPSPGEDGAFEKRVHQKMANMELAPSGAVWEKVDERLHPQQKNRRWLIWLMLLAGLILGSYVFRNLFISSNNKKALSIPKNQTFNAVTSKPLIIPNKKRLAKPDITDQTGNSYPEKPPTTRVEDKAVAKDEAHTSRGKKMSSRNTHVIQKAPHFKDSQSAIPFAKELKKEVLPAVKKTKKIRREKIGEEENLAVAHRELNVQITQPRINNPIIEATSLVETQADSVRNPKLAIIRPEIVPAGEVNTSLGLKEYPSATTSKIKLNRKYNIRWGFVLVGGRSAASSGSINSLFQSSSQAFYDMNALPSGNTNLPVPVPSVIKAGPAFEAGLFVKRQLNAWLSMSVGLNYNLYTLSNKVGEKIDSTINVSSAFASNQKAIDEYFKTGNSQKYVSRYHFIELPVLLHAKLSANERIPVALELGFSLSRLMASNALHYNSASGIYYNDNKLFNKTQLNLLTGLPIRIFSANTFLFEAGPHFQYGITNLLSDHKTGDKHFFFLGVKASILLRKK